MRTLWLLVLGLALWVGMWPMRSEASFMASCSLDVRILQVEKAWGEYGPHKQQGVPVRLHIVRIASESGHVDDFCSRQGMVGTGQKVLLLANKPTAKIIQVGSFLNVTYTYVSGLMPRGAYVSHRWHANRAIRMIKPAPVIDVVTSHKKLEAAFRVAESATQKGQPLVLYVSESDPAKGLQPSCPGGVRCDQHFAYHAQRYYNASTGFYLYLSFAPSLLMEKQINRAILSKHFRYVNISTKLNSLESKGWFTRGHSVHSKLYRDDKLGREVKITGYQGDRIQGEIAVNFTNVHASFRQPPCVPVIAGVKNASVCTIQAKGPITLWVRFDLPMTPRILDCKNIPRDKACR